MAQFEEIIKIIAKDMASKVIDKVGAKNLNLVQRLQQANKVQKVVDATFTKHRATLEQYSNSLGKTQAKTHKLSKSAAVQQRLTKNMGLTQKTFNNLMGDSGLEIQKSGKIFDETTKKTVNQEQAISKLSDTQANLNKMFSKSWRKDQAERIEKYTRKNHKLGMDVSTMGGAFKKTGLYIDKSNKIREISNNKMVDSNVANHRLVQSTKRFKMELLSVMFFGMAVQRFFGALTKGSLEASGAMNVWSTITMLMGLPVAMSLTKGLLWLLKMWSKLGKGTQKTISIILYAGMALGAILMIIGTVGLGIGGISLFFGNLFPVAATKFSAAIAAAGGGLKGFLTIVGPIIIGVLAVIIGAFRAFSGFLKGDWWKIVSGILLAVAGVVALVLGGWIPALVVLAIAAFVWLGDKVPQVAGVIMAALSPLVIALTGIYDIIRGIVGLFQGKSFKEAFDFGTVKKFTSQMVSKLKGEKSPETKLAAGGIVTRPIRALIGEAGPEAVIPLNRGFSKENIVNYNPTININANISSDMDIQNIARRINDMLYTELRGVNIR